jgi:hypothetical protein
MPDLSSIPNIAQAQIEALDKMYPAVNPDPSMPIEEIMYRAGQRNVVLKMKDEFRRQSENVLGSR